MSKAILQPFEDYQKARFTFVQSIAELAQRPQNIIALHSAGVMPLLRPLLLDSVQVIQQSAALAIGRLANYSEEIAESVIQNDIITQLIYSLSNQNRFYKKAACYVLRAVAKHSPQLADDIVKSGALEPLIQNLSEFDATVKESAAWALGYIAKHNTALAEQVVEAKAIENLVLCLQEPEIELKRAASRTLCYIAQHTPELASRISDQGLEIISHFLMYNDTQLKRNVCLLLGNIAKHSIDLSINVWNSLSDPQLLLACLMDPDLEVKKNTAFCVSEIVNKGPENAMKIVNKGGLGVLVHFIANVKGDPRLYGIIAIGFIAAHNEKLSEAIIDVKGIDYLKQALASETLPHIKSACCYALGQIGKHAPKHANKVAEHDVLGLMLDSVIKTDKSEDLNIKARRALKKIINNCNLLNTLEPLLKVAPPYVLQHILVQYDKYLKDDREYKKEFVKTGGLRTLQEIRSDKNCPEDIQNMIDKISREYPEEVVNYYSPAFQQKINKRMEEIENNYS
jgi:hypothetical protein